MDLHTFFVLAVYFIGHKQKKVANWVCLILVFCAAGFQPALSNNVGMRLIFNWTHIEYDYPTPEERQSAIDNGLFRPGASTPIDVDVYISSNSSNNKIFVTTPRWGSGIPASLGYVSDRNLDGNPLIVPYPDWTWHQSPALCNSNRIVSVFRTQVDECNRLWVLDAGTLPATGQITCLPQILAFDLTTNQLVHKYEIPNELLENRSVPFTPVVDIRDGKCDEAFIYVADGRTYSIIVYDVQRQTSWKATDKTMYPYPSSGTFTIEGVNFESMDGILGMTLEPYKQGQERRLFYHALASTTENWVYTSDLRNQTRFINNPRSSPQIFHVFEGKRTSQSAAESSDKNGIVYYGTVPDTAIRCWNTNFDYEQGHNDVVAQNATTLQFVSGVKVITQDNGNQTLWVITNRLQNRLGGSVNPSELNYRILAADVDDLTSGTLCVQ